MCRSDPENVTTIDSAAYQELAAGGCGLLKRMKILAYVSMADTRSWPGIILEGLTAFVLAYQEVTDGALTTALMPTDIAAIVGGIFAHKMSI